MNRKGDATATAKDKAREKTSDKASERVVVFDLGNVLIRWDRRLLFGQLIDDEEELDWFLDEVFTLEANQELDRGTPLPDVVANVIASHPSYRETLTALLTRWPETLGGAIEGSQRVLEELFERNVRCIALSNWGADTFAMIEDEYQSIFRCFEAMVISGREGLVKPGAAIFELMCDRHQFSPEQAVFIDDSPANIATSLALGFDGLLFTSPAVLREQLRERKLL